MIKKAKHMSVFEQIKSGLEDGLAHARGELTLVTIRVPAPPPRVNGKRIVALRKNLHMSQSVFAATLNVSMRTVQSWEQGLRKPSDASLRLLQIIGAHPTVVKMLLVPYLRASAKNNKKFHAAISISCWVDAAKRALSAVLNSRPLRVTR